MNSVYIHIPFCSNICSYCDFCKIYYNESLVDKYLESLEQEIKSNYKNEVIKTLYIGGGTPSSLSIQELHKLFNIIKIFKLSNDVEFTIECNPENTDIDKLKLFKDNHINRLSIGVETFNSKYLELLNRKHSNEDVKLLINNALNLGITNINVDLIYGLPNQTIDELKEDINELLKLNITHISTYSLILEEHTKLYIDNIKNINQDSEYQMYEYICNNLKDNHFNHYEISNFSKETFESKHNLTYWNNLNYYGFGLGAHGYIDCTRYENTRSITKYCNNEYIYQSHKLDKKETMENEMILGLRKINGVNKTTFKDKYHCDIIDVFTLTNLLENKDLVDDGNNIYIPIEKIYISNDILINFVS